MILLIDNYDSFSYNLYQLIGRIRPDIQVIRNDDMTVERIREMEPEAIVISPGPGKPSAAGCCEAVVQKLGAAVPILGVCLGHQAICEAYGGVIRRARELMHGRQSTADVDVETVLFQGLPDRIRVARYHSLALDPGTLPECLTVTGKTEDGEVMAVQHREYPVYGLQFHPESILTPEGEKIIQNFLGSLKGRFPSETAS